MEHGSRNEIFLILMRGGPQKFKTVRIARLFASGTAMSYTVLVTIDTDSHFWTLDKNVTHIVTHISDLHNVTHTM